LVCEPVKGAFFLFISFLPLRFFSSSIRELFLALFGSFLLFSALSFHDDQMLWDWLILFSFSSSICVFSLLISIIAHRFLWFSLLQDPESSFSRCSLCDFSATSHCPASLWRVHFSFFSKTSVSFPLDCLPIIIVNSWLPFHSWSLISLTRSTYDPPDSISFVKRTLSAQVRPPASPSATPRELLPVIYFHQIYD